jgi:hypothetical protein
LLGLRLDRGGRLRLHGAARGNEPVGQVRGMEKSVAQRAAGRFGLLPDAFEFRSGGAGGGDLRGSRVDETAERRDGFVGLFLRHGYRSGLGRV